MKFKFIITALIGLLILTTSCAKKTESTTSMEENKDSKILVAYFSATGTTKHVAEELAQVMEATLFEIKPETPYTSADLDWRDENNLSGKRIISFATSGGSPIEPCIDALQKQYPKLDWGGGKLLNHTSLKELNIWKEQLGL